MQTDTDTARDPSPAPDGPPSKFTVTQEDCEVTFLTRRHGETLDNLLAEQMDDERRHYEWCVARDREPECGDKAVWQDDDLVAVIRHRPEGQIDVIRLDGERPERLRLPERDVSPFAQFRVADDDNRAKYELVEGEDVTLDDAISHACSRIYKDDQEGYLPQDQVVMNSHGNVLAAVRVADLMPSKAPKEPPAWRSFRLYGAGAVDCDELIEGEGVRIEEALAAAHWNIRKAPRDGRRDQVIVENGRVLARVAVVDVIGGSPEKEA